MTERYKVLGAMLAFEEFTVRDLADLSGVKEATVRTVLNRSANLLETLGKSDSEGRGGRFIRYRLRPEEAAKPRSEIEALYQRLPLVPNPGPRAEPPLGLLAAEDALLRLFPQETSEAEKARALELAETAYKSGRREIERLQSDLSTLDFARLGAHLQAVQSLMELSRAEITYPAGELPQEAVDSLAEDLVTVACELSRSDEKVLFESILERAVSFRKAYLRPEYVLVDAIQDREAPLMGRIHSVLEEHGFPVRTVPAHLKECKRVMESSGAGKGSYVVVAAVDSDRLTRFDEVRDVLTICSRTNVLDAGLDRRIWSEAVKSQSTYVGKAAEMDAEALFKVLMGLRERAGSAIARSIRIQGVDL